MNKIGLIAIITVLANDDETRERVQHELELICKKDYDMEMVIDDNKKLWFKQKNQDFLMAPWEALGKGLSDMLIFVTMCIAGNKVNAVALLIEQRKKKGKITIE